jgi:hypothetical protein
LEEPIRKVNGGIKFSKRRQFIQLPFESHEEQVIPQIAARKNFTP